MVGAVNQGPMLTLSKTLLAFQESQTAGIAVDSSLSVSDVDTPTLLNATVAVTTGYVAGIDLLSIPTSPTWNTLITDTWANDTGVLTLAGAASPSVYQVCTRFAHTHTHTHTHTHSFTHVHTHTHTHARARAHMLCVLISYYFFPNSRWSRAWQAALRAVIYQNFAETTQPNRTITFAVTDGSLSTSAGLLVTVEEVNDLPEIQLNTTGVAFDGSLMTLQPTLNITDRDSRNLSEASVTISSNCDSNVDSLLLAVPAVRLLPESVSTCTPNLFPCPFLFLFCCVADCAVAVDPIRRSWR
jgi:hypothetical protein